MFQRHSRPLSTTSVHRATVLNRALTPTSRLLYTVLASLDDDDLDLDEIAVLAGLPDTAALTPFFAELSDVGVIEVGHHAGQGEVLTVHCEPQVPAQRTHACIPCQECDGCACDLGGLCRGCSVILQVKRQGHADITEWKQRLAAGATYAIARSANRLHRWNCPTLITPEKCWLYLEGLEPYAAHGGYEWPGLPTLYTADELRRKGIRKKHCGTCGPEPL